MHLIKHFQAQELQQQQQQQQQHQQQHGQHDHTDGRNQQAMNFLNVMPNPAIKTEPRDTSPLPYGMYNNAYRMPDQTPSPQPVSPSTPYNHNASGTPSPYNMGAAGNGGNLISPSHQYGMAGGGPGGAGAAGGGAAPNGSPMDYDAYHQQQQQQQHHPGAINTFNHMQSPPTQWPGDADIKQPIQNINQCQSISINLSNYNVTSGILTKTAAPSAAGTPTQAGNNQPWNLLSGAVASYNINNLMTNTQHNQHHHHQPQAYQNHMNGGAQGGPTPAAAAASNNEAPSISSLLNMDSDKLLQFNSEELSNLSIS